MAAGLHSPDVGKQRPTCEDQGLPESQQPAGRSIVKKDIAYSNVL